MTDVFWGNEIAVNMTPSILFKAVVHYIGGILPTAVVDNYEIAIEADKKQTVLDCWDTQGKRCFSLRFTQIKIHYCIKFCSVENMDSGIIDKR